MISLKSVQLKVAGFILGAIVTLFASAPALAESPLVMPPEISAVDGNGVNLANGKFHLPDLDIGIGVDGSGLTRITQEDSDNWTGTTDTAMPPPGGGSFTYKLSYGGKVYRFAPIYNTSTNSWTPGPYTELGGGRERLSCANEDYNPTAVAGSCLITLDDGTKLYYNTNVRALGSVVKPDGEVISLTYYQASGVKAIKSVSSSLGWMLKYEVYDTGGGVLAVNKVTAINTSATYCDPNASSCSVASSYPSVTKSVSNGTTTIARNGTTRVSYTAVNAATTTITSPGGVTKTVTIYTSGAYSGRVYQVSMAGSTWTYSYAPVGADVETTIVGPNGTRKIVISDVVKKIVSQTDEAGRVTTYAYSTTPGVGFGRLYQIVNPDGNSQTGGYTSYQYNTDGDVTKTIVMPKNGTTNYNNTSPSAIVTTAVYGNACNGSNGHYCHKPTSVTDANGVTTDYVYDTINGHGGLTHIYGTLINSVKPETRYTYAQFTPYIKNAAGNPVAQPQVWRLTETRACMTLHQNTCYGGNDERVTINGYTGNNILPTSTTVERGNGTLSQTSTVAYNDNGQLKSATGPKGGIANQAFAFYDALGRSTGTIGIDPDDTGPRLRQASRTSYDTSGRAWKVEAGTVNGITENDVMNGLTVLTTDTNEFSSTTGLAVVAKHYEGATLTHLTQQSYDNLFRTDCVAQRLNPAVFGSVTSTSACSLGTTNADGTRDRITKYNYHAVMGMLVSTISGYGTPSQVTDFTSIYDYSSSTSSGNLTTVADAKGNITNYYYDSFNRPVQTCFAQAGNGGAVNTSDCQSITYRTTTLSNISQAGTLPAAATLRDGQTILFNYDLAGRLTSKTVGGATIESVTYNNFNQALTHSQNGVTGTYGYNSLGWLMSDAQPMGTVSYEYDAYGRRSRMWWPGNTASVTYSYNNDDGLAEIFENGNPAAKLAGFGYNNSTGARELLWRPNAQHSYYYYGDRSGSFGANNIGPNLVGLTQNSTNVLSFTYNSADQIKSRANSNANFNYAPSNASIAYSIDGLNRISNSGIGYDGRGNLNSDNGNTYTYNINNLLTSALQSGLTSTLTYDAENRLASISKNGTTTKFLYDGVDLIAEYDGSNTLLRRYVHGAGTDEPLVMYDSAGNHYYLHADQQGTITHLTNENGSLNTAYTYDAYGLRQTVAGSLESRFSYTGQTWLPEIGMYYYKARLYHPAIGRFMQTDPIGYGDGMNWYAYVGNDPVNMLDPSGLGQSGGATYGPPITVFRDCWSDPQCSQHRAARLEQEERQKNAIAESNLASLRAQQEAFRTGPLADSYNTMDPYVFGYVEFGVNVATLGEAGVAINGLRYGGKAFAKAALEFCARCLVAGTEVATPNGLVPIEKIKLGDLVLAFDEATGQIKAEPVTALIRPDPKATFAVKLIDIDNKTETFRASADHPWLLKTGRWASTEELKAGDHLKTATGIELIVTSVKPTGKIEPIYNLTVDNLHTYLIGKNHVVVHNTCMTEAQRALKELVKQATHDGRKPLSFEEMKTVMQWAKEVGYKVRAGIDDLATPSHWDGGPHFHFEGVGSGHIKVTMPK